MAPVQTENARIAAWPSQTTLFCIKLLWANGVAPRKEKVAPDLSNQAYEDYTDQAITRLMEMDRRLQIAEGILLSVDGPLFSQTLKAQYRRRLNDVLPGES